MNRATAALLGAAACAALLAAPDVAQAQPAPPQPPRAIPQEHRVDSVDWVALPGRPGAWVGASIYLQAETFGDRQVRQLTFMDVRIARGGAASDVARLRMSTDFARDYKTSLQVEALGDGDAVLILESRPQGPRADERDAFKAVLALPAAWRSGPLEIIWSGTLDPIDPRNRVEIKDIDGDGTREVILSDLDRRVLFCGAGLGELLPRIWDFKKRAFVNAPLNTYRAQQAPQVTARLDRQAPITSHLPDLITFRSASSDLRDVRSGPGGRVSLPVDLNDGNPDTAWVEGAPAFGLGEFVTAEVNPAFPLRGLRVIPGLARDERTFNAFAAPAEILLTFSDGSAVRVDLPRLTLSDLRETGGLYVDLPSPVTTSCLTLTLLRVHPLPAPARPTRGPDDGRHTALSELTPLAELDYEPRQEALRRLVEAIAAEGRGRRSRDLLRLARSLGAELRDPVLDAVRAELQRPPEDAQLARLIPLLATLPPQDAVAVTSELLAWPPLPQRDLAALQRAVSFEVRHLVPPLLDLATLPDTPDLVRERIVHLLGRAAEPELRLAFVNLLGVGSPTLRKDTIRALAAAPLEVADPLLDKVVASPGEPAAHDGLWALERLTRRAFRGQRHTLPGAERILQAYTDTPDTQIRIRALRLLQRVELTHGDTFLATVLASQERPELRALAAQALAHYPSDKATDALLDALQDTSPNVRIAAITALRSRPDLPRVVQAATTYARLETWNQGLENAYALLAASQQRDAPDYLYSLIEGGDDRHALLAIAAIHRAHTNVRTRPIARLIQSTQRPLAVREEAVRALAFNQDPDAEALLIELLLDEDRDTELRQAAANTFQHRRTPTTFQALQTAAQRLDPPELHVTVVRAFAYYITPESLQTLRSLKGKVPPHTERYIDQSISIIESRQSFDALKDRVLRR